MASFASSATMCGAHKHAWTKCYLPIVARESTRQPPNRTGCSFEFLKICSRFTKGHFFGTPFINHYITIDQYEWEQFLHLFLVRTALHLLRCLGQFLE